MWPQTCGTVSICAQVDANRSEKASFIVFEHLTRTELVFPLLTGDILSNCLQCLPVRGLVLES